LPKPDVRVGDSWSYQRVDYANTRALERFEIRVVSIAEDSILAITNRYGLERNSKWTSEWNTLRTDRGSSFRIQSGLLRFPLEIGKTHQVEYETQDSVYGTDIRFRGKTEVVGWEDIVVPAGKFQALKIQSTGRYYRLDATGSSPVQETIWYVPGVKRWVKRLYVDIDVTQGEELVSFAVK